ncbi:MAG: RecX family transcriptional regulator [Tidjanibacter sp.]|nr:RecX family transcriptional regulator [Tidjanibacter sp.]
MPQAEQIKTKTPEQALAALMRLCSRAERSSGDARRLMVRWGVPAAEREGVLDKLIEMRFIDDSRYAAAYVRDRSRFGGWGTYKIRAGLKEKGVAQEVIDEALAQITEEGSKEQLRTQIERKAPKVKAENDYELKTKLIRFALSRGFEYDTVLAVVEQYMKER